MIDFEISRKAKGEYFMTANFKQTGTQRILGVEVPIIESIECSEIHHEDCSPIHCSIANKWTCSDCGDYRYDDARVEAGMKCGYCAYGNGGY